MALQDGSKPQVVDPEVVAGLQRVLTIRGPMGVLDVLDLVIPTISLGQVQAAEVVVRLPSYRSTNVFTIGVVQAPAINTILADTGPLPAGTYDVSFQCSSMEDTVALASIQFEHRDAANAANLAFWDNPMRQAPINEVVYPFFSFGYELDLNERLRARVTVASTAGRDWNAVILARIR